MSGGRFVGGGPEGVVVGEASAGWGVRATRMSALRTACDVLGSEGVDRRHHARPITRRATRSAEGRPPPNVQFPRLLVKSFRRFGLKKAPQLSAARPSRPIKALTLRDG